MTVNPGENGTILIADDNDLQRILLKTDLNNHGYDVVEAHNGRQALVLLQNVAVDVLLLDLQMPEVDGITVLTEMRADEQLRHTPVLVISGEEDRQNIINCIELGATDYLIKPIDPILLRARIRASLVNKRIYDLERATREQIESQRALLENLVKVSRTATESLALSTTLENILRISADLAAATTGSILLLPDTGVARAFVLESGTVSSPSHQFLDELLRTGLAGWVIKHRLGALIRDTRADQRWAPTAEGYVELRSALCVPIIHKGQVLGALTLGHVEPGRFETDLQILIQAVADQISIALVNAQAYEMQRRQTAFKNSLYETLVAISKDFEPDELLNEAVQQIAAQTAWPTVAIFRNDGAATMVLAATAGVRALAAGTQLPAPALFGAGLTENRDRLINNIRRSDEKLIDLLQQGSAFITPIGHGDDAYGILLIADKQTHAFRSDEVSLARSLARVIGLAFNNALSRAEIRASEARYRDLFENAFDLIQGVDAAGKFRFVNRRWQEVMGYSEAEIIGRDFADIIAPDELAHCQAVFANLDDNRSGSYVETRFVTKMGEEIFVEGSISARYGAAGLIATRGIFRDVTRRRQTEEALMANYVKTNALYEVARVAVVEHDIEPRLNAIATAIAASLPADRVSLIIMNQELQQVDHFVKAGPGIDKVIQPPYGELQEGLSGWVLRHQEPALSPGDKPDPRESAVVQQRRRETECGAIIVAPLHYRDRVLGTITAINRPDEREFNQADVDLIMAMASHTAINIENASLYAREKQRTRELQASNDELDAFAGTVAHDLKNPLTTVMGITELVREMDNTNSEQRNLLDRVVTSANKMSTIINELLLLARVRKVNVPLVPVNMLLVTLEAIVRLESMRSELGAQLTYPDTWPDAIGYGPWLEEVWANYLSNALKYGGRPPVIELGYTELSDHLVEFWIQDNGPGLTPEALARLFTPFERLEQSNISGHGLGLSIVKRIVEKCGGQVGASSQPGQGSRFSFILRRPEA